MKECRCGTSVPDDRRTCPELRRRGQSGRGRSCHSGSTAADNDHRRAARREPSPRAESLHRKNPRDVKRPKRRAALQQQELTKLAGELRNVQEEIVVLKEMLRGVDDRQRLIRARFESMDIPMFRPFEATQASLFPQPDNDPKSKETR